jgi:hypothetical protein
MKNICPVCKTKNSLYLFEQHYLWYHVPLKTNLKTYKETKKHNEGHRISSRPNKYIQDAGEAGCSYLECEQCQSMFEYYVTKDDNDIESLTIRGKKI